MRRQFTITLSDEGEGRTCTKMEGFGFHPLEVIGYLEQCKVGLLKAADKHEAPTSIADLVDKMRKRDGKGGFNIEELLGGLPRGIKPSGDDPDC